MIMMIGVGLIIVGFAMVFMLIRNSKRPRLEVKLEQIEMLFVRQDKKQQGPQHLHGLVKYNYDGVNYESWVLLKTKKSEENQWIQVTVNPKDHALLTAYAPKKEQQVIAVIFVLGLFITVGSWWLVDYLERWW